MRMTAWLQSGAVLATREMEAARRPFRTGAAAEAGHRSCRLLRQHVLLPYGCCTVPAGDPSRAACVVACMPGPAGGVAEDSQLTALHSREVLEEAAAHISQAYRAEHPGEAE